MPSVFGCIPSGSRYGNVPNELIHRAGPPFLDNHYRGYQYKRKLESEHSLVVCMFSESCTEGTFRKLSIGESNGIFIQYCSGGSWHYLCSGGAGWTPTLATVACRQLGYSDQGKGILQIMINYKKASTGAHYSVSVNCTGLPRGKVNTFRTKEACEGMDTSLTDCGGVQVYGANEACDCGQIAEIMCQSAGKQDMGLAKHMYGCLLIILTIQSV